MHSNVGKLFFEYFIFKIWLGADTIRAPSVFLRIFLYFKNERTKILNELEEQKLFLKLWK